ncbi:hypothetical protein ETH_00015675 [Eimeria tenella]|uniref:Uncharacterized protein n=1 Tax=Eimeria tenella TaxID=5802 RepID=U6KMI9_EIMTE|nr:hypothetical protein ETH_00015675 [Eimeria tenella]CDJ39322.1 hypothetical protein ETH_00015675 [Eimeria tenella]|eukprot:XP_013230077.1 hypothetical protein ETH_00015675 [Eimeria tenella]
MAHLAAVQEQIMAKISSVNEQSQDVMQQIKKTMERELARRT